MVEISRVRLFSLPSSWPGFKSRPAQWGAKRRASRPGIWITRDEWNESRHRVQIPAGAYESIAAPPFCPETGPNSQEQLFSRGRMSVDTDSPTAGAGVP